MYGEILFSIEILAIHVRSELLLNLRLRSLEGLQITGRILSSCHMDRRLLRTLCRNSPVFFHDEYAARIAQSKIRMPPVNAKI